MKIRVKPKRTRFQKRTIGITKPLKKGVSRMTMAIQTIDHEIESKDVKLTCMSNIRKITQKAIKEKGLTDKEIRKTLGVKRYEI